MSDPIEIQAGLGKKIIRAGNGEQLKTGDVATVHCKGMLMEDRKKFWR
jgi:FKBP-type peptidyl-prolyl cis-trans isomerase